MQRSMSQIVIKLIMARRKMAKAIPSYPMKRASVVLYTQNGVGTREVCVTAQAAHHGVLSEVILRRRVLSI